MGEAGASLDEVPVGWALLATAVFVGLKTFFVAAEFSAVQPAADQPCSASAPSPPSPPPTAS